MTTNDINPLASASRADAPVDIPPNEATIDALLDGEEVDTNALRAALGDPASRDYFVDALVLRRLTGEMAPRMFAVAGRPASPSVKMTRWLAAAAVIVATAAGGYVVGRDSRVLESGEQAAAPSPRPHTTSDTHTVPAPAPTAVIRFERGKNWVSDAEVN